MKQLILSISDSNMPGDTWQWNFYLEREAAGTHTLSCEQIIEDDPLVIDPVDGLRNGADIYEALSSMLENCDCYHLGDQDTSAIAEKIAKVDVAIAKQFSAPSEPAPTSAQERDFYRRVGGGPVTVLRPAPQKPSAALKKNSRRQSPD
jgi:hypothetical protein